MGARLSKRTLQVLTAGLVLALTLLGCDKAKEKEQDTTVSGETSAGQRVAEQNCQPCHAIGASGASTVAAAPPFREIVKRFPPESLAESLAEGIEVSHSGKVQMPNFKLEEQQIQDLISYLQTLQPKE